MGLLLRRGVRRDGEGFRVEGGFGFELKIRVKFGEESVVFRDG